MKPIKNLEPAAKWILRISLAACIICLCFNGIKAFDFKNIGYIINLAFVLFAVLLLLGGIINNATLTILSGIVLSLVSAYKIYEVFSQNNSFGNADIYLFLMIFGVGMFFAAKGNS